MSPGSYLLVIVLHGVEVVMLCVSALAIARHRAAWLRSRMRAGISTGGAIRGAGGRHTAYNKCSTSEAILTGQDSKPKQQFSLRLAANRFEARIAASVSNSQGVGQPWQER